MPSKTIDTTCPYCGVGCGVSAQISGVNQIEVQGSASHPANHGRLCVKGSNLATTLIPSGRVRTPKINGIRKSWDEALDQVAINFRRTIEAYGPDSIAFYLSGQLLTEDYYVANKFMKGFVGSANVDTNSRLCMASAVAAHKRAFGEDIVPCNYTDIEQCDLLVLTGSNTAWAHPIVYQRIVAAKAKRQLKVVVIDPRTTATCDIADLHLNIQPGADLALFNGLLRFLVAHDAIDHTYIEAHCDGFTQTSESVLQSELAELEAVSLQTGADITKVRQFYELFATHHKTVTLFSQGINQSSQGTDQANAIINCHLATGRIGKPGQGPFSITGQPNAMGGREVGGMANQLAAHMDFNETDLDRVGRFWHTSNLARRPGLKAVDMFAALARGDIKAIWIMGTNPAVSLPNSSEVRTALKNCPVVVVSDCIEETDTNQYADILLPAQGWGEKDGTVTNSERCISRQRRIVPPLSDARPDWQIISSVAQRMGFGPQFNYASPAEIFSEHARLTGFENHGDRLLDISHLSSLSAEQYNALEPQQWPRQQRPFANGRFSTPNRRARFIPTPQSSGIQRSSDFPLVLNSGRVRDQWHTMTRTGQVPKLFGHTFAPLLQIHPLDARKRRIEDGNLVLVANALGEMRLIAQVTEDTPRGSVFAPIHWSDHFTHSGVVSHVVKPAQDPISGQPASKHSTVECRPLKVTWWVRLVSYAALETETLRGLSSVQYWTRAPFENGWQYELGTENLEALLSLLVSSDKVEHHDSRGACRALGRLDAKPNWLLFADHKRSRLPSLAHIESQLSADAPDWQKLSPLPLLAQDTSALVCTCFEVRKNAIMQSLLESDGDLERMQAKLKCGTNCGSCVPELNRLVLQAQSELKVKVVNA